MKKTNNIYTLLLIISSSFILYSCTAPKAYQKMFLNDAEMELAPKKI